MLVPYLSVYSTEDVLTLSFKPGQDVKGYFIQGDCSFSLGFSLKIVLVGDPDRHVMKIHIRPSNVHQFADTNACIGRKKYYFSEVLVLNRLQYFLNCSSFRYSGTD